MISKKNRRFILAIEVFGNCFFIPPPPPIPEKGGEFFSQGIFEIEGILTKVSEKYIEVIII